MADPVLWRREDHTEAKHRVLRSYVDAWIPVMANQALEVRRKGGIEPKLLLVDGFAGPGRYLGGEPGSPLIMLDALRSHRAFGDWGEARFRYVFIESDRRRVDWLRRELAALGELPPNLTVEIQHGEFESCFGRLIEGVRVAGQGIPPTFAFIDPFGYSESSLAVTGRLLELPRCEALVFLPLSFVERFVGRAGQERALTSLFGCEEWREAIPLGGKDRERFLLALFERQLRTAAGVAHVRSFQIVTQDGRDYRLVFGLGHEKGLEKAKDAMWKVDPLGGVKYRAETTTGQEVLLGLGALMNSAPLLAHLRERFSTEWFTIEAAERSVNLETPFRKEHLRSLALKPAEAAGELEVDRTGPRGYPKRTRLRFVSGDG